MKKLFILIAVLSLIGSGIIFWYFSSQQSDQNSATTSAPTPTPTPTPPINIEAPDGWKIYTSEIFGYSVAYPPSYALEKNSDNSMTLIKSSGETEAGPTNFIYISIVPEELSGENGTIYNHNPKSYRELQDLEVGQSVSVADLQSAQEEWFTYTRVDDVVIDGHATKVYENTKPWEFPVGTTELRYYFDVDGDIYLLGYYSGGDSTADPIDPSEATRIIQTFTAGRE